MKNLTLIEPTIELKDQYIDMIQKWMMAGENMTPFVLRFDFSNFESMIERLVKLRDNPVEDEKTVNSSTFWLINNNSDVIGAVNIRHKLNKYLQEIGGHIGFGIMPSERRKGYATELLKLALLEAKRLGIEKALVTCDKDNVGSAKTIIKNGGVLDSEAIINGVAIQRYWIDINV